MNKRDSIAAAILAGGMSSRMGRDKALLELEGKPFIRHITGVLSQVCTQVVIVSDYDDRYRFLGLPIYPDIFKNCGPLGGIHSAMKNLPAQNIVVVSCDIPFIDQYVLERLVEVRGDEDVTIISMDGLLQPLCAIYHTRILPTLEDHLKRKQFSVRNFLDDVSARFVAIPPGSQVSHPLVNINTPEEYALYCSHTYIALPSLHRE